MQTRKVVFLTPVYNDWESYMVLVERISAVMGPLAGYTYRFLAVDDFSTEPVPQAIDTNDRVTVVHLVRNMGHQRALAIGMAYIRNDMDSVDLVISLDGDGEDRPEDIPLLLEANDRTEDRAIVFAQRRKRSEGGLFRLFYVFYKFVFTLLTGQKISFGNYSLIPFKLLERLVYVSEIWNNYPSAVIKSRLPYCGVLTDRGRRYKGESKMNFVSLVLHGLSAVSVYIEVVAVRLILFFLILMGFSLLGIAAAVFFRFFTPFAVPGWATNMTLGFLVIIAQGITGTFLLTFMILSNRNSKSIIPNEDYRSFIKHL
jgi:glycosyltransferase involved in cell wall biosynthesis